MGPRRMNTSQKLPVGRSACASRTSAMTEFVVIRTWGTRWRTGSAGAHPEILCYWCCLRWGCFNRQEASKWMSTTLCTARSFYHHEAFDFCQAKHEEAMRSLEQEGTHAAGGLCGRLVESKLVLESTIDPRDLKSLVEWWHWAWWCSWSTGLPPMSTGWCRL